MTYSVAVPAADKPLRIAFLTWRDQRHPEAGGAEVFLERVSGELRARGHEVTILTARYEGSLPTEVLHDGRRMVRVGGRYTVYPRVAAELVRRRRQFDAIVDIQNGVPFWSPLYSGKRVVCVVHHVHREQWEAVFPPTSARIGWTLESRVGPAVYRRCEFLAVSESTATDLAAVGVPPERIHVAYSGLDRYPDLGGYDPGAPPRLVAVGRLVPHKRLELAIDALATLRPRHPGLTLDIAGSGYHEEDLVRHAQARGVADSVRFAGRVSEEEKNLLLSRATAHLVPSLKEGWGLTIIEAAAQGTPSVAFRSAGGTRESIVDGRTGFLADSPDEFLDLTARLLREPELRAQLSKNASDHSLRFDWAATAGSLLELLRRA